MVGKVMESMRWYLRSGEKSRGGNRMGIERLTLNNEQTWTRRILCFEFKFEFKI